MKVVVSTCDGYRWIIPVFMYFWRKYYPNCPYEIIIITETKRVQEKAYYTKGGSWSRGIKNFLKESNESRILLILEDLLLMQTVDTERVRVAEKLCEYKTGTVRLNNAPHGYFIKHSKPTSIDGFREYPLKQRFIMGLQPAVFQKNYLLDALGDRDNPWEAEQKGAKRLASLGDKWKSLWPEQNIFTIQPVGLMKKGRLRPRVLRWAKAKLKEDNTKESMEIYGILQDQIKRQDEQ